METVIVSLVDDRERHVDLELPANIPIQNFLAALLERLEWLSDASAGLNHPGLKSKRYETPLDTSKSLLELGIVDGDILVITK